MKSALMSRAWWPLWLIGVIGVAASIVWPDAGRRTWQAVTATFSAGSSSQPSQSDQTVRPHPSGFRSESMRTSLGEQRSYLVFQPRADTLNDLDWPSPPVLLFLNGLGNNGNDGYRQLSNVLGRPVWEMSESFPFAVVAPQCPLGSSWSSNASLLAIETLDDAVEKFGWTDSPVVLCGVSSGGAGAMRIASDYADRLRGVVLVSAAGAAPAGFAETLDEHEMPAAVYFNQMDEPDVVATNTELADEIESKKGIACRVVAYPRRGHDAWNYAFRDPELYRWLLDRLDLPLPVRHANPVGATHRDGEGKRFDREVQNELRWRREGASVGDPATWFEGRATDQPQHVRMSESGIESEIIVRADANDPDPAAARRHDFNRALSLRFPAEVMPIGEPTRVRNNVPWSDFERGPRLTDAMSPRQRLDRLHAFAATLAAGHWGRLTDQPDQAGSMARATIDITDPEEPFTRLVFLFDPNGRLTSFTLEASPPDDSEPFLEKAALPNLSGGAEVRFSYWPDDTPRGWVIELREGKNCPLRWRSRASVVDDGAPSIGHHPIAAKWLWGNWPTTVSRQGLPYEYFVPKTRSPGGAGESESKPPLTVLLHGAGDRANRLPAERPFLTRQWTVGSLERRYRSVVIAPRCPLGMTWCEPSELGMLQILKELIDGCQQRFETDPRRTYVLGHSMGGEGCLALAAAYPTRFAAVVSVSGYGHPETFEAVRGHEVTLLHGTEDRVVPIEQVEQALARWVDPERSPKLERLHGVGHDAWSAIGHRPNRFLDQMFSKSLPVSSSRPGSRTSDR